jgi:hypothetical protein
LQILNLLSLKVDLIERDTFMVLVLDQPLLELAHVYTLESLDKFREHVLQREARLSKCVPDNCGGAAFLWVNTLDRPFSNPDLMPCVCFELANYCTLTRVAVDKFASRMKLKGTITTRLSAVSPMVANKVLDDGLYQHEAAVGASLSLYSLPFEPLIALTRMMCTSQQEPGADTPSKCSLARACWLLMQILRFSAIEPSLAIGGPVIDMVATGISVEKLHDLHPMIVLNVSAGAGEFVRALLKFYPAKINQLPQQLLHLSYGIGVSERENIFQFRTLHRNVFPQQLDGFAQLRDLCISALKAIAKYTKPRWTLFTMHDHLAAGIVIKQHPIVQAIAALVPGTNFDCQLLAMRPVSKAGAKRMLPAGAIVLPVIIGYEETAKVFAHYTAAAINTCISISSHAPRA